MSQEFSSVEYVGDCPPLVKANKEWNDFMLAKGAEIQRYRYINQIIEDDYLQGGLNPDQQRAIKIRDTMYAANRADFRELMDEFDRLQENVVKALMINKQMLDDHKKAFPKHDITARMIDDTLVDSLHAQHEVSKGIHFTDVGTRGTKEDNN